MSFTICTLLLGLSYAFGEIITDFTPYLQPDDILDGSYDNENREDSNLCTRKCDGNSKICYYILRLEQYSTMGLACGNCSGDPSDCQKPQCVQGDGYERGILSINRRMPGPSIQVCKGDTIVVDLVNQMLSDSTSLHWHGIRQIGTQYYDGVPKVTQCPINPGETFRYFFNATDSGTFFYHSHSGLQKLDGIAGTLNVREDNDIVQKYYDFDFPSHTVFVSDWLHKDANQYVPGLKGGGPFPESYLINGKGVYAKRGQDVDVSSILPYLTTFYVVPGHTHRFRLVSGTCLTCAFSITFLNHKVSVIYGDGAGPINPTPVDTVMLSSADRFDVVLHADQEPDTYWIMVRGDGPCYSGQQFALLRYVGHNGVPSSPYPGLKDTAKGFTLNPQKSDCTSVQDVCLTSLTSPVPPPSYIINGPPDQRIMITLGGYPYDFKDLFLTNTYQHFFVPGNVPLAQMMNRISNVAPPSPLLSQEHDIPQSAYCKPECYYSNVTKPCTCTNVIHIKLNDVVEMVVMDGGSGLQHPYHVHGYNFYILEEGKFGSNKQQQLDDITARSDKGEFYNRMPIQKDTVDIPSLGYAVLRFKADNPGYWIVHCHFVYHVDMGMSVILKVGDLSDVPPVPIGFPKCSDFKPPLITLSGISLY